MSLGVQVVAAKRSCVFVGKPVNPPFVFYCYVWQVGRRLQKFYVIQNSVLDFKRCKSEDTTFHEIQCIYCLFRVLVLSMVLKMLTYRRQTLVKIWKPGKFPHLALKLLQAAVVLEVGQGEYREGIPHILTWVDTFG